MPRGVGKKRKVSTAKVNSKCRKLATDNGDTGTTTADATRTRQNDPQQKPRHSRAGTSGANVSLPADGDSVQSFNSITDRDEVHIAAPTFDAFAKQRMDNQGIIADNFEAKNVIVGDKGTINVTQVQQHEQMTPEFKHVRDYNSHLWRPTHC